MFANGFTGFGQAVKRTPEQIKKDLAETTAKLQQLQAQKDQKLKEHVVLNSKLQQVQSKIAAIQAKRR